MQTHVDWGGPEQEYRYTLWRIWEDGPFVQFIGLNPSTADELTDDPTIRKCIGFAKRWGYGAICMTNLFAWRDTKPENMKTRSAPIGPDNDLWLAEVAAEADMTVAAWGNHGSHMARDEEVKRLLAATKMKALRIAKTGQPWHPLYVPYETELITYG